MVLATNGLLLSSCANSAVRCISPRTAAWRRPMWSHEAPCPNSSGATCSFDSWTGTAGAPPRETECEAKLGAGTQRLYISSCKRFAQP